jgi:hypothetical protein
MKFEFTIFVNNVEFRKVKLPKSITNKQQAIDYARNWIARKEFKKVPRVQILLEMITPMLSKHTQWSYQTSDTIPPVEKENLFI